jgi:hypothetical protein
MIIYIFPLFLLVKASFKLKCITYKSEKKKEITSEILSQDCIYLAVYIKLDPTHTQHSNISARHVIISILIECRTTFV